MSNRIVTRPPVTVLPGSALVRRGVSGRTFTPGAFAKFAKGHVLKLKPGASFAIHAPNTKTFDAIEGRNQNTPFTFVATRDLNASLIRIGVKPGAKVGASDVLTLLSLVGSPSHPTSQIKTRFKLVVASPKDV